MAASANYSVELISFISMISSAVKGLCIILIVKRYLWDSIADKDIDDDDAEASAPSPAEAAEEDARVNSVFKITF